MASCPCWYAFVSCLRWFGTYCHNFGDLPLLKSWPWWLSPFCLIPADFLSLLVCPYRPVFGSFSWISCLCWPALSDLSLVTCSYCFVPDDLPLLSYPCWLALNVLSLMSYLYYLVLPVWFLLGDPYDLVLANLSCFSWTACHTVKYVTVSRTARFALNSPPFLWNYDVPAINLYECALWRVCADPLARVLYAHHILSHSSLGSLSHPFCSDIIRRLRLCLHLCMHSSPCFASEASQHFTLTSLHVRGDFSTYSVSVRDTRGSMCLFLSEFYRGFREIVFFQPHILPFPYSQGTTRGLIVTVRRWP